MEELTTPEDDLIDEDSAAGLTAGGWGKYARFVLAALGSLPWVGGLLSATAALHGEAQQEKKHALLRQWVTEHEKKSRLLTTTLVQMKSRLDQLGDEPTRRIADEQYLDLVRKGFRIWDRSDTDEKRDLVRRLLTNAAATTLCADDLVRLFLDWIDRYHEIHFRIIAHIAQNTGITRAHIWQRIHGVPVREDSAEADLFRFLIRELSMGGVIRQHRERTMSGDFVQKPRGGSRGGVMKSAFDDSDAYELTELGRQFVHYSMDDVVPRIGSSGAH